MIIREQKITVETDTGMTNPLTETNNADKIGDMVTKILDDELPMLKNNSLLHDLVLYTVLEKMNTVQNVKNVLSYIKDNRVKEVRDVYFRNGEVRIKCSI